MASELSFAQYICDQLSGAGDVVCRKMFGEYGIYRNEKLFGLICDNMLYIKITEAGKKLMPELTEQPPYEGAKPYFLITDPDDREKLCELVLVTCELLPEPKPKPRPKKNPPYK